jgi:PPP family 3-phenylpropionic acid transporter
VELPYLPLWLLHLGFSGWQIGLVVGLRPAFRWGGAFAWAWAADRWRIRRRILVGCALAGAACLVPLLFVGRFAAVAAVIGVASLFHGPLVPLLDATVMDHLPRLGGDYGRLRLWGSAAFVVGALASAPLVRAWSPAVVPLLLVAPAFFLAPALARLPAEQLGREPYPRPPWRLVTPALGAFLGTAFLMNMSCGAWGAFFAVHTARLGFSDAVPGVAWGVAVSAETVLLFFGGRLLARLAPTRLLTVSLAVTVLRWILTATLDGAGVLVLLQTAQAFTFAAFHLAAVTLVARLVPVESSTGGQALYGVVGFGLGGSLGIALCGLLVDPIGTDGVFLVDAAIAALALVPALWLARLERNART